MQLMGSLKLAPKGMRCNGSGGLYGGDMGITYGPGIVGDAKLSRATPTAGRGRRGIQAVDQPLLTVTPFQKATRPRISAAAALGSG
jgi:hypothetical protein